MTSTFTRLSLSALIAAGLQISLPAYAATIEAFADDHGIADRVRPAGVLVIKEAEATPAAEAPQGDVPGADAPASADASKATYDTACFACHGTGAAGAPIVGNADQWSARIAQGNDTLYSNAINGKGGMPPKGGAMQLSDDEIKAVVDYMVAQSQ
jgi:cytochrome c5